MEFLDASLRWWESWLKMVGATMVGQRLRGGVLRSRTYEIERNGGLWTFHLHQWDGTRGTVLIRAPDGLRVVAPEGPDWDALEDSVHYCTRCFRRSDDLQEVGFHERLCSRCRRVWEDERRLMREGT